MFSVFLICNTILTELCIIETIILNTSLLRCHMCTVYVCKYACIDGIRKRTIPDEQSLKWTCIYKNEIKNTL